MTTQLQSIVYPSSEAQSPFHRTTHPAMSLLPGTLGHRLIPSVIDYYAAEAPDKIYASVPRSEDLSKGFTDVTYKQLANAIDHASWWLDSELGQSNQSFETFAYSGPKDLQYPVLAVAAAKVGRTVRSVSEQC